MFEFVHFCLKTSCLQAIVQFSLSSFRICRMTSPQGMDELFWGREHEDVSDWVERLTMAAEVRNLNADKLFKIAKLNLRGRAREWLRRLQLASADWTELRTLIL